MNIKKLFENWKGYLTEQPVLIQYSIKFRLRVSRKKTKAVIDDTLARIRAIPGITVVNSDTDEAASDLTHAVANVEFKFIPLSATKLALKQHVVDFKKEVKRQPFVDSVVILWNTLRKVGAR